jgi:hypothetical protein
MASASGTAVPVIARLVAAQKGRREKASAN